MTDQTLARILELNPEGQEAAIWLINSLRERGLPAIVVEARRTFARQLQLRASGRSQTLRSKHLEGRALDLAFAGIATEQVPLGWWHYAGTLWEKIGGTWGGRWHTLVDRVHFQW